MDRQTQLSRTDLLILRTIAIYHLLKAAFFFALSFGVKKLINENLARFLNDYVIEPFHFDPDGRFLKWLMDKAVFITPHQMRFFSYVFFAYGVIFAIEGFGLYWRQRWAEYMVVIVVSSLLPFEVYEIYLSLAWWKILFMIGNLLVVGFLIKILVDTTGCKKKS